MFLITLDPMVILQALQCIPVTSLVALLCTPSICLLSLS